MDNEVLNYLKDQFPVLTHRTKNVPYLDIMPVVENGPLLWQLVKTISDKYEENGIPDFIVGIESRGFILGSAIANRLKIGFVAVRKPNKLPDQVIQESYGLEYGKDTLELQLKTSCSGKTVVIVDDILATGGTANATINLLGQVDAKIMALEFLIELPYLDGRKNLPVDVEVNSLIEYSLEEIESKLNEGVL